VTHLESRRERTIDRAARRYAADLRRAGPTGSYAELRAYLGSPVPVLGIRTPEFRRRLREFDRTLGPLRAPELARVLARLWRGTTYEERLSAIELLDRHPEGRTPALWRQVDRWVDTATGWALSDSLAAGPISGWLAAEPVRFREVLRWTRSPNFWRRRAASYALRDWVLAGRLDRPFRLLDRLLDDEEFWVRRAVGTWLRECGKRDRARTNSFLRAHAGRLSCVTITVATERSPKAFRAELRRIRAGAEMRRPRRVVRPASRIRDR